MNIQLQSQSTTTHRQNKVCSVVINAKESSNVRIMVLINRDGGIPCFLFAQRNNLWWLYPKVSAFPHVNNTIIISKKSVWTLSIDVSCKTGGEKKKEDLGSLSLWHIRGGPFPALAARQRIKIKWLNKEIRSRWRLARAAPSCPPILQLVTSMIKKTMPMCICPQITLFGSWKSVRQGECLSARKLVWCGGQTI